MISALCIHAWAEPAFDTTKFSDAKLTPSPAVICAAASGEVYVGVDKQGSLGKAGGLGSIVRLIDSDNDGVADKHTVYAKVDNPRGLIAIGTKLWVLHSVFGKEGKIDNQYLSVFTDADNDGVADGPPRTLVKDIGNHAPLKGRGTDHSTNGLRLGIDGWIYISVGDFGFQNAIGADGRALNYQGGGVVRVRPDGSGLENFVHGTRNVYDVAIDPFMNVYTRENNNDGVGWWIRFSHYVQTGEYGYPSLYMNFPEDMLSALNEYGGGSGTGALFLSEPGWPEAYNNKALLCDWGRSQVVIHGTEPKGASFVAQKPETFHKSRQVTDLDVDASGRVYVSAWDGAGFKGNPGKGFVERLVPKGFEYKPFPRLGTINWDEQLLPYLASESHTARVDAQQEILARNAVKLFPKIAAQAADAKISLAARVAAVYTLSQLGQDKALPTLAKLYADDELREHVVRCMGDQHAVAAKADTSLLIKALSDPNDRVKVAAAVALGRTGKKSVAPALLAVADSPAIDPELLKKKGDKAQVQKYHSIPQYHRILGHVARQALLALDAQDETIAALNSTDENLHKGALFTMKYMHSQNVVDALIKRANSTEGMTAKMNVVKTLIRLHQKEKYFDTTYKWWSTRPNPHGPYYYPVSWAGTESINAFIKSYLATLDEADKTAVNNEMKRCQASLNPKKKKPGQKKQKTVGDTSLEDLIISLGKLKPNAANGKKVINKIGCIGCHNVEAGQTVKAPDLSKLGKASKTDVATSIVRPAQVIAKTWVTITTKDGTLHTGTLVKSDKNEVVIHNIAGIPTTIKAADVKSTAPGASMMLMHLADSLTLQEFSDLVEYIQALDPSYKK
jgi:putative heme-binding domain-containing protein